MRRCPYCATELKREMTQCPGCNKKVGTKSDGQDNKSSLTSRKTYEKATVPVWLFVVIVGVFLLGFALIFFK